MDGTDLRVFEAVARLGGMSRAAVELHTVQSNVTARIQALEQALGVVLFHRHTRGVTLAPAGQRLLPYAKQVARLLQAARQAAQDDGTPRGALVIGSLETTAAIRLSQVLADFAGRFPLVDLTLRTDTTCALIEQVLDGALEGAFVCGPVLHPDLVSEAVFSEELALLTPPGVASLAALAAQSEVRIVVLRRGCSYRQRLEDLLVRRGMPVPRVLEFGTLEAILACVAGGLGVTLLPRALVAEGWLPRLAVHTLAPGGCAGGNGVRTAAGTSWSRARWQRFWGRLRPAVFGGGLKARGSTPGRAAKDVAWFAIEIDCTPRGIGYRWGRS